jgi:tetratricopeptide (TPR) repeat protein
MTRDQADLVSGRELEEDSLILRAIGLAERSGNAAVLVGALGQLGMRLQWRGEYRNSIESTSRAVALADEDNAPGNALFSAWFLGIASVCIGDYARGFQVLGDGLSRCQQIGDRAIQARLLNTLGWTYAEIGCHERAAEFNRRGTELAREAVDLGVMAGAPELYANGAINLAGNLLALGRSDDAAEQLAPIQRQLETDSDPWMSWRWSAHLLHAQARLALAAGDPQRALGLAERELEVAVCAKSQKLIARAHELAGRLQLRIDDRDAASRSLATALAIATRIEHPSIAWRAHSLLAELARRAGDANGAERHRAATARLFDELAPNVPDPGLRQLFRDMGAGLVERPL